MSLQIRQNLLWAARVLWAFLRLQPVLTISVIGCLAGSQISRVLAFFLPLKVLLLASSDGIPRVLQPVVQPEYRTAFIVALSIGAVFFFALTLALEALAQKLTKKGGAAVLVRTNKLARGSLEHAAAPRYYTQICDIAASFSFVFLSVLVLALLNPLLTLTLLLAIFAELIVTLVISHRFSPIVPDSPAAWIKDHLSDYLLLLQSLTFLFGFFALLTPFLFGEKSNILVVLLSFLLLRQTLVRLKKGVQLLVKLVGERHTVDPLVFHNCQEDRPPESTPDVAFRALFHKTARQRLAATALNKPSLTDQQVDAEWLNPTAGGIYVFKLTDRSAGPESPRIYLQRVFPPKTNPLLEHEEYLFHFLERRTVNAPNVIARGSEGIFQFQICEAGTGRPVSSSGWPEAAFQLLVDLWSVRPRKALVNAYLSSRPMLQSRLTMSFVERARIAIDDAGEEGVLGELLARLEAWRERLSRIPVVVVNPQLAAWNTHKTHDGGYLVMSWAQWRLEPLGYGAPGGLKPEALTALAEAVASKRNLPSAEKVHEDMEVARNSQLLEAAINARQYKRVFTLGSRVLESLDKV